MVKKTLIWYVIFSLFTAGWTFWPQNSSGGNLLPPQIEFGKSIQFTLQLNSPENINAAYLFLQPNGQETQILAFDLPLKDVNQIVFDLTNFRLRPFSPVEYWYRLEMSNGEIITGEKAFFTYEDNRFPWQRLSASQINVAWYSGDLVFGQQALDTALAGIQKTHTILDYSLATPVSIYIYPSASDLQSVLNLTPNSWVAGHASPDLGVVLVSILPGPDQRAEMERQIPHELMHIVQYQLIGDTYINLPVWLTEGLASMAELYPNPDYQSVLKKAVENDTLLPMVNLCSAFPAELSGAILSYAQSDSFVRFLYQNYGATAMRELIIAYKDGLGCEEGVRKVYGTSIAQLETRWRQEVLGMDIASLAWSNLQPYMLISAFLLLPFLLTIFLSFRKEPGRYAAK